MRRSTRNLTIVLSLAVSALVTLFGARQLGDSLQLARHGVAKRVQVVDRSVETFASKAGPGRVYTVDVIFPSEKGGPIRKRLKVSKTAYNASQASGTVVVTYLPERPEICTAADDLEIRYGNLVFGICLLGMTAGLIRFFSPAGALGRATKLLMQDRHQYVPADVKQFGHLDLAFYDEGRKALEQHGYKFVADLEDVSFSQASSAPRTFIRTHVSADGVVMGSVVHFKPSWWMRLLGAREAKFCDFETWFSNGCFVCTSNAEMAGSLESPPAVNALFLPADTWLEVVRQKHQQRLDRFAEKAPDASAIRLSGLDDVLRAQHELQRIKAEFCRQTGFSGTDWLRMITKRPAEVVD